MDLDYKKYTAEPDGEACFKKMLIMSKYTGGLGIVLASYDTMFFSLPQGYVPTIANYLRITTPLIGAGLAFVATAHIATNMRKKDDRLNYVLGGLAAGGIIGGACKSYAFGVPFTFSLAVAGFIIKDSLLNGWEFFPNRNRKMGLLDHYKYDWTLTKDVDEE